MSDKKIAVILGEGASMAEYNPKDYPNALVLTVNSGFATYKRLTRRTLKADVLIAMDKPHAFDKTNKKESLLATPKETKLLLHYYNLWKPLLDKAGREGDHLDSSRIPTERPDLFHKFNACHGNFSVTACIYYALKQGCTELYVFGHDISKDWYNCSPSVASRAIKEINFAHRLAESSKGFLSLSEGSALWDHKTMEGVHLSCRKTLKKKKATKKTEPTKE